MKVHLFYISFLRIKESESFNLYKYDIIHNSIHNDNNTVFLHSYTNNDEYANIFKSIYDMNIFTEKITNISKKEYSDIKKSFPNLKLKWNSMRDYNNSIQKNQLHDILSTKLDINIFDENCIEYMEKELFRNSLIPYTQYKDLYINALDKIMYCTFNQLQGIDSDIVSYNYSYGITAENAANCQVFVKPNVNLLWIKFYSFIMRKNI